MSTKQTASYVSELRDHREEGFTQLLAQQGHTATSFEEAFGSEALEQLKRGYTHEFMMIQNHTRGRLGELWGEVLLTSQLRANEKDIEGDSSVFWTPFGHRRVDVFWPNHLLALEAKSGTVFFSRSIRKQIDKDKYLLENGVFSRVIWVLLQGASQRVREALQNSGIIVVDGYTGGMPPEVTAIIGKTEEKQ
ncbi:MAG TPA: hypothetical protein VF789_20655 [Thermoanaerobaculia bacterium]